MRRKGETNAEMKFKEINTILNFVINNNTEYENKQ